MGDSPACSGNHEGEDGAAALGVGLHRGFRQEQLFCDFPVGGPACHQAEDVEIAVGDGVEPLLAKGRRPRRLAVGAEDRAGEGAVDPGAARGDRADRLDEVLGGGGLQFESCRAGVVRTDPALEEVVIFTALGRLAVRRARLSLFGSLVVFALTVILGGGVFGSLSTGGFDDPSSDSARTSKLLEDEFGAGTPQHPARRHGGRW